MTAQTSIFALLDELRNTTASIYFVPDIFLFELIQANISNINGIPIIAICDTPFSGPYGMVKRLSDVLLSLFFLFIMSPVLLFIALGVKFACKRAGVI